MKVIFLISVLMTSETNALCYEFLYPISSYRDDENQHKLLVMYQKSSTDIELWSWDPLTQYAEKMLPSSFSPAGVRIIPDNKGFSFIDNGRIRIKEFMKRSTRSIDIQDSLSNIGLITWSTDGRGYFHAKEHRLYHIFSLSLAGDISHCIARAKADCMYPVCVEGTLFYIERTYADSPISQEYQYRIIEQPGMHTDEQGSNPVICADFHNRPIIFLTMINAHKGFVVEHALKTESDASTISFSYHYILRDYNQKWHTQFLFSFSIPSYLLRSTSRTCLYESILPLLPRLIGSDIYYVDKYHNRLALYTYNLDTQKTENLITPPGKEDCLFIPVCLNSRIFCGGRVRGGEKAEQRVGPRIFCDSHHNICFSFLYLS